MAEKTSFGKLYLIPSAVEEVNFSTYIPAEVLNAIEEINVFVVEELKTARRFIKKVHAQKNIDNCTFFELNEHTQANELNAFLQPLLNGQNTGLLSEAGCPAIADPGQNLVQLAHANNIQVIPLVGPSSLLLALMASGLNGQSFMFNGYLPKEQAQRKNALKELEKNVAKTGTTHLFIETPYRNNHLLEDMLAILHDTTMLCIACEIKSAEEFIQTKSIDDWKKQKPDLNKKNTVFILGR